MSTEVVRLRLAVAYDGGAFAGWATQPGLRTVQETLEETFRQVLRHPERLPFTVAGRTDAGVHARGQVCHVDVPVASLEAVPLDRLRRRLASALPLDVRVVEVAVAPEGFDARFSAVWRRYAYRLCDDPAGTDPLMRGHVLAHRRAVDVEAMNEASAALVGEHDFAAFCKKREGATTIRTLQELSWVRDGHVVVGRVVADAFCHNMVRSLVGCLLVVGEGKRPVEWPGEVLRAGVRDPRVPVVAAHGLVLEEVGYPADELLAARAEESRKVRTLDR